MGDSTDPRLAELGAFVRRSDGAERELARAEVLRGLFGRSSPTVRCGRYQLRRCIGRGARGVVYEAYDPRLRRTIAIKRLPDLGPEATVAVLAEGRALARVRHPNVLEIYDVRARGSEPYLAMELVDGVTLDVVLARLPRPVPWRDVVAKFVAAAEGLAAIHDAGLVHRDFKPSNVLVATDGRVKVADLGLARSPAHGGGGGTAVYAAPEQTRGEPVDAAADQYSLFVALFEALTARLPVPSGTEPPPAIAWPKSFPGPRRLQRTIARGLAPKPAERFGDMRQAAAALRDCLRRPRKWPWAIGVVVLVGASWLARSTAPDCRDGAVMDGVWDAERRSALRSQPWTDRSLGTRIEQRLDGWADDWLARREAACASETIADDARRSCLARHQRAFATAMDVLLESTTPRERALEVLGGLPDPAACDHHPSVPSWTLDPREGARWTAALARVDALGNAGRYADGLALVGELAGDAGSPALRAELELRRGCIASTAGDYELAETALREAHALAVEERIDHIATHAAADLVGVLGEHRARYDEAARWERHARARVAMSRADPDAAGRLEYNVGRFLHAASRYERAEPHLRTAVELRTANYGPDHPKTAAAGMALGTVRLERGRIDDALPSLQRALDAYDLSYGNDHPDVAVAAMNVGRALLALHRTDEAGQLYARALAIHERTLGPSHYNVAASLNQLGEVAKQRGEFEVAVDYYRRARAMFEAELGADHPKVGVALNDLGVVLQALGRLDEAEQAYRGALEIMRADLDAPHRNTAYAHLNLGTVLQARGDHAGAELEYARAAQFGAAALGPTHPVVGAALLNRGVSELERGDPRAARDAITRAIELFAAAYPADHPHLVAARQALAAID